MTTLLHPVDAKKRIEFLIKRREAIFSQPVISPSEQAIIDSMSLEIYQLMNQVKHAN